MRKSLWSLVIAAVVLGGCRRGPSGLAEFPAPPGKAAGLAPAPPPGPRQEPPEPRATLAFDDAPLPRVISVASHELKAPITVSPTIPVGEWSRRRVSLRMKDATLRAFLDWLVRPLQAQYALEADSGAWLSRGDDLLDEEPFDVRSYRVPTHLASGRPVRGALVFEREQAAVVEALHACLRYLEERRPGCRIAFHGGQDVLVARLPARGHARLRALLQAMRHGCGLTELPSPSLLDLRTKLDTTFTWDSPPGPASRTVFRIAEVADVSLGWDPAALATRLVAIPAGKYTLRQMLDAVVRQTPIARYEMEPGHGIWLYTEGQDASFSASGATAWDRAVVRAYEVRPVLPHMTPEALLAHVRKQVDPAEWGRGLPAAAVFLPTGRLLVVHDEAAQLRVATVIHALRERYRNVPVKGAR
ncbi:MAG TPA: hypothetical protein VNE39_14860 [Planctomycetota bacterium]|nr:hypothetical protein [Planctomycetota bacterium]